MCVCLWVPRHAQKTHSHLHCKHGLGACRISTCIIRDSSERERNRQKQTDRYIQSRALADRQAAGRQGGRQQVSSATWAGQMKRGPRCLLHHPYNQGWKLHQQKDNNQWGVVRLCSVCVLGPTIKGMKDLFFTLWLELCVRACMRVCGCEANRPYAWLAMSDQSWSVRRDQAEQCVCVYSIVALKTSFTHPEGSWPGCTCVFVTYFYLRFSHLSSYSVTCCCTGYQSEQKDNENHLPQKKKMYPG